MTAYTCPRCGGAVVVRRGTMIAAVAETYAPGKTVPTREVEDLIEWHEVEELECAECGYAGQDEREWKQTPAERAREAWLTWGDWRMDEARLAT